MNIQATKTLYFNTLHKEFRSKTIYFLFALTIMVIFIIQGVFSFIQDNTLETSNLILGAETKMTAFFIIISIWNVLLGAIMGVGCTKTDVNHGVIHQILSLPIKRVEYLIARILGTWSIVIAYYLVSIATGSILFSVFSNTFVFNFDLFPALFASALSMLAVITWGLLFSHYSSKIVAFITTTFCALFVSLANSHFSLKEFSDMFDNLGVIKFFGLLLHYLCPRTGTLNSMAINLVQGKELDHNIWIQYGHFVATYLLFFGLVHFLFKKKNF